MSFASRLSSLNQPRRHPIRKATRRSTLRARNRVPLFLELLEGRTLPSAVLPGVFNSNSLGPTDDGTAGPISLGFSSGINLFGTTYTTLFINNNGNVTFGTADTSYTPSSLTAAGQTPRIAPFFADVDTRGAGSGIVSYGTGTVNGRAAFGVNWPNVGYYSLHTNKLDNFQLVLIERFDTGPGNFDIEMNYNQIQWETGDPSGSNGLGGNSAHAGYTNGSGIAGTNFEFVGSGVNGAFLDTNSTTGLINHSLNSTVDGQSSTPVNGRYIFLARAGAVNVAPSVASNLTSVSANEGTTATNTGTWSDTNVGDTVTLSASVGTVTKSRNQRRRHMELVLWHDGRPCPKPDRDDHCQRRQRGHHHHDVRAHRQRRRPDSNACDQQRDHLRHRGHRHLDESRRSFQH